MPMEPINLGHIMFDGLKPLKNFITDGEIPMKSSFGDLKQPILERDPKIGVPPKYPLKNVPIVNYPFWGTPILGNHPFWGGNNLMITSLKAHHSGSGSGFFEHRDRCLASPVCSFCDRSYSMTGVVGKTWSRYIA